MRSYENQCVGCPPDIGCMGEACKYMNVPVNHCDRCDNEDAIFEIDGNDYCGNCAKEYLQEMFDELTTLEKAEMLDVDIKTI